MSEYVVELPESGAADECIRVIGCEKKLYGYELSVDAAAVAEAMGPVLGESVMGLLGGAE